MFDDLAYFNSWLDDATNQELAYLYLDWLEDECILPLDFSLVDECFKRGITLTDLEALTNQQS